jgi:hypothetical protein
LRRGRRGSKMECVVWETLVDAEDFGNTVTLRNMCQSPSDRMNACVKHVFVLLFIATSLVFSINTQLMRELI